MPDAAKIEARSMILNWTANAFEHFGLSHERATRLVADLNGLANHADAAALWQTITRQILTAQDDFSLHRFVHERIFDNWDESRGPPPVWFPTPEDIDHAHVTELMHALNLESYDDLHAWSVRERPRFWSETIARLNIQFHEEPTTPVDLANGVTHPRWLPGAMFNIVDSCFGHDPDAVAIRFQPENGSAQAWTVQELEQMSNRVANGLVELGLAAGDAVAIDMPMTAESVAIYLGIIRMGGVAVSIADSFAAAEISTRLRLGKAVAMFTQDVIIRNGKRLPLYEKTSAAGAPMTIVLPADQTVSLELRHTDLAWQDFLSANGQFTSVPRDPDDPINVLFSSGTTGEPKTIPWAQSTPIKCAADGYYHMDIHPGDVVGWPTNLGWMMGPWLIFAALINKAALALYYGAPTGRAFGQFVQDAGVTMLGVVPTFVKAWRETECMQGLDWTRIRCFSSTGECSNADDMFYLTWLAGYRPVIEYCGGTELAGAYIAGVVTKAAVPAAFNTFTLGTAAVILDPQGGEDDDGELFLLPPTMGFSNRLMNSDHHEVYYRDLPPGPNGEQLRRHGDQIERLPGGYYRAHGRMDDTMNLGGIKVSSAEIERVVVGIEGVREAAAVTVAPEGGGPEELVIVVVPTPDAAPAGELLTAVRERIRQDLNPLFRVKTLETVDALPRTASNKVMRRVLRVQYEEKR